MRHGILWAIVGFVLCAVLWSTGPAWAQLTVNPTSLSFSGKGPNCTYDGQRVTVMNNAGSALNVTVDFTDNMANAYWLSDDNNPDPVQSSLNFALASGTSRNFYVFFKPPFDTFFFGNVRIRSDGGDNLLVSLLGDGYGTPCRDPYIELDRDMIFFGDVAVGCQGFGYVDVYERDGDVEIESITYEGPCSAAYNSFWSVCTPPQPDCRRLIVVFEPQEEDECITGYLTITTNSPLTREVQVFLLGPGVVLPEFVDVPIEHWAFRYIMGIFCAFITAGCDDDPPQFCPENPVVRQEMAAFIIRAIEWLPWILDYLDILPFGVESYSVVPLEVEPPEDYCESGVPFPDLASDMWSCRFVKRLKELGITAGYPDGTFGPYDPVTRREMAVFITRALDQVPADGYCGTTNPFSDVNYDDWGCKYIKRLAELGISVGYGDGRYGPDDYISRAQMAVFLKRAFLEIQ